MKKYFKKIILSLIFTNYERGIIRAALGFYCDEIGVLRSETAREDGVTTSLLISEFQYKEEDPVWPFRVRDKINMIAEQRGDINALKDDILEMKWRETVL